MLWLKRTDGGGYGKLYVESRCDIYDLTACWLSDKKLDADAARIALRLVKRGGGVPDASEEAYSTLLADPSVTLRAAGIIDNSWLLVDCVAAAPAPAMAESAAPRARFVRLLREACITRPDVAVLQRAERHFPSALLAIGDAHGAADLYMRCKHLPGTTTRIQVREATGVTLHGPLSGADGAVLANVLVGIGYFGEPLVAKLLYDEADSALQREMCETLQLAPWDDEAKHPHWLVRASFVDVRAAGPDAVRRHGAVSALFMPRYPACLAELPQLSCHAIARGAQQLFAALQFLHAARPEAPWVHMDVKAANVMVDGRGNWLLADFGACTPRGADVLLCTELYLPPGPEQGHPLCARVEYDYDMLLVLLVIEVHKSDWRSVLFGNRDLRVNRLRLLAATEHLMDSGAFSGAPEQLRSSFAACVQAVRRGSTLA